MARNFVESIVTIALPRPVKMDASTTAEQGMRTDDHSNFAEFYKSKELKGRNAMKRSKLLPILLLMLTSLALAQSAPSGQQSSSGAQAGTPRPGVRRASGHNGMNRCRRCARNTSLP